MEKKCINCKHFRKGSVEPAKNVWGDCVKPGQYSYDSHDRERPSAFTWAHRSCDDFEPRETPVEKSEKESQAY